MSGRLIISRHKSWHVWNGDNQEKVLRDERLHREQEAEKRENERRQIQNKTLESLGATAPVVVAPRGKELPDNATLVEQAESKHKNLFGDCDTRSFNNKEYLREKEKAALIKLKREGIAPWALGDGSYEAKGKRAWYETLPTAAYSRSIGETSADDAKSRRSDGFKRGMDPMKGLLKSRPVTDHGAAQCVGASSAAATVCSSSDGAATSSAVESKTHSSSSSFKGHDRAHRDKDRDRRSRKKARRDNCVDIVGAAPPDDALMESLRARRLERERGEQRRSAQLLAQYDVFGRDFACRGGK
jgi:hypothetical protein